MVRDKKFFIRGLIMALIFLGVLIFMFSNSFNGTNAFHASDGLFNSISKGSTNYFTMLEEGNKKFADTDIVVDLKFKKDDMPALAKILLDAAGAKVSINGNSVEVQGNLGRIIALALSDAHKMFNNNGQPVADAYNMPEKQALFVWWNTLRALDRGLKGQKQFKAAKFISEVIKRGIEVGYNYYGVQAQSAKSRFGVLSFSLIFYVVYTLWWGFAIFYLFEGFGLEMSSGSKKEM